MQSEGPIKLSDFPAAPVNEFGITDAVMQYLEVPPPTDYTARHQLG